MRDRRVVQSPPPTSIPSIGEVCDERHPRLAGVAESHPTVLHLTHQKAGSQWVYAVLSAFVADRIVPPLINSAHLLGAPVIASGVYPTCYVTREEVEVIQLPDSHRKVAVIRDLRDTLVSLYFSVNVSHVDLPDPELIRLRDHIRTLSRDDGLRLLMHEALPRIAAIQLSWSGGDAPLVRYCELVSDPEGAFGRLLRMWAIRPTSRQLRSVVRVLSFEAQSGRIRGVEDVSSHLRKGMPGDWRNHLHGDVLAEFKEIYDEVLIETGYEASRDWGAERSLAHAQVASSVAARPARERSCWCGSDDLLDVMAGYQRCRACTTLVSATAVMGPSRAKPGFSSEPVADVIDPALERQLVALLTLVPPGGRVLDAAAGNGLLLGLMKAGGLEAEGLEADRSAAMLASEVAGALVGVGRVADMEGPYDAIVLHELVGRDLDPLGLLRVCRDRLTPGGAVCLEEPLLPDNASNPGLRRRCSLDEMLLKWHARPFLFTAESLDRLLSAAGFDRTGQRAKMPFIAVRSPARSRGQNVSPLATLLRAHEREREVHLSLLGEERRLLVNRIAENLRAAEEPLAPDDLVLGVGWHQLERADGHLFRWAGEDAEIRVGSPTGQRTWLLLDIEPGPSVGCQPFKLDLLDPNDRLLDTAVVGPGRCHASLTCPCPTGEETLVRLRTHQGGRSVPGDPRILNFRVFSLKWG